MIQIKGTGIVLFLYFELFFFLFPTKNSFAESFAELASKGKGSFDAGNFYSAIHYYKEAVERNRAASAETQCYLGNAYFNVRSFREALVSYDRAVELNPGYVNFYLTAEWHT